MPLTSSTEISTARSRADYTKAFEIDPKSYNGYLARGHAYRAKGDLDRSIADYSKAIEIDPRLASAYVNRGIAYSAEGDLDRAIADYTKAIQLDPKYALAYNNRGVSYRRKGDPTAPSPTTPRRSRSIRSSPPPTAIAARL